MISKCQNASTTSKRTFSVNLLDFFQYNLGTLHQLQISLYGEHAVYSVDELQVEGYNRFEKCDL